MLAASVRAWARGGPLPLPLPAVAARLFSSASPAPGGAAVGALKLENVLVEARGVGGCVGVVTLNRPKSLNALCAALVRDIGAAVRALDGDAATRAIVLTGSAKAFAAGADIKEMAGNSYAHNVTHAFLEEWEALGAVGKPLIAAVNGFALGGGCELAMLCDIVLAGDSARFGQPEIKIGTIPGAGGTQRLTRAVGKARAMEMVLGGDMIDAETAARWGLAARVVPAAHLLDEAVRLGERIAAHSPLVVRLAKRAVNQAFETALQPGLAYEKSLFWGTFATRDQKEGMAAFMEKRPPRFTNE